MRGRWWVVAVAALPLALLIGAVRGEAAGPAKGPPPMSSFQDFLDISSEFELGLGNISKATCTVSAATQPAVYAGNSLIDCDAEVPHNETTVAVHPGNASHAVGGFHTFQIVRTGASVHATITTAASVTFDGGSSWREVIPPIAPYQFTGDPALTFAGTDRLYFAAIADHEGEPGFPFTGPSVIVQRSDDGGVTWSSPVTVAAGSGAVGSQGPNVFNDKEYIAGDTSATSPFRGRAYVTWTRFRFFDGIYQGSPIFESHSDDGVNWTEGKRISGSHPACSTHFGDGTGTECNADQFSVPAVAPNGRVYVSFENFNTPAENQLMVVSSGDGGTTFSPPVRAETIFDINLPENVDGRSTLTGCQLRWNASPAIAADPSDPTGKTVYVSWADNRNGSAKATNTDVLLARSADGGQTWRVFTIDNARNDQFYPWVAVAPNGRVDVGYMDRSYSSGQKVCQYGFTLTRLTFDSRGRIASKTLSRIDTGLSEPGHSRWFSARTDGNATFIGDYNNVAVGPDGSTWSDWTDQRALVADPPSPTRTHGQHAVAERTAP